MNKIVNLTFATNRYHIHSDWVFIRNRRNIDRLWIIDISIQLFCDFIRTQLFSFFVILYFRQICPALIRV